ncbi:hypothetical protein [Streptomyces sp. NPDC004728]|uniref:hypothetical protein n=1 Tax=Streptomyces sp. NPDC004728 TaxID=3154289 RepID=UPI0033ACE875
MPEPEGQETNGPAKKAVKKPAKKAAKRAALKPRPPGSILNNPALAGAQTVVARSVLGQGASGADAPASLPQASAEAVPALPPRPQATSVVPAPSQPVEGQGTKEPAAGETYAYQPPRRTALSAPPVDRPADHPADSSVLESRTAAHDNAAHEDADVDGTAVDGGDVDGDDVAGTSEASPTVPQVADASAPGHEEPPSETAASTPARVVSEPVSEAGSSVHTAGARKKRASSPRGGAKLGPAHEAIHRSWRNSRVDLKMGKQSWQTHAFRFAPDLVTVLSRRVAQDSTSARKTFTAAQYVDAAMSLYLPGTIAKQLELAEEFLLSRDSDVGTGKQASHRVSAEVYAIASPLANELRIAGHPRLAVHVYSGALDRFLQDLAEEGPLGPTK